MRKIGVDHNKEGEGWQAELHQYLDTMPANVMKDTDIMK